MNQFFRAVKERAAHALEKQFSAPQRYGTAFHISPPFPDVRQIPQDQFVIKKRTERVALTPADQETFLNASPSPYFSWHSAHLASPQVLVVPSGTTKEMRLHDIADTYVSDLYWIVVEPGATLLVEDMLCDHPFALRHVHIIQKENSQVTWWGVRGNNTFLYESVHVSLIGRGACTQVVHLVAGNMPSQSDMGVRVDHREKNTVSNLQVRSTTAAKQTHIYRGLLDVDQSATGTQGYQHGRSLLLSSHAKADIVPELHIRTNDVKCSHGVTTTHIDDAALFYVRSRGIPLDQARQLAIQGFFHQNLALPPRVAHTVKTLNEAS